MDIDFNLNMVFNGDQITKAEWYTRAIKKCIHCV